MTTDQQKPPPARAASRWPALAAVSVSVVALAAAGVALALAAVDYQPPKDTEPPKITDWMQGWGSVVGVMAGLLAAVFTAGLLVHEMREARRARMQAARERAEGAEDRELARRDRELAAEERRDAEAEQARSVIFSDLRIMVRNVTDNEGATSQEIGKVISQVRNYSDAAILDVRVFLVGADPFTDLRIPVGGGSVIEPGGVVDVNRGFDPAPSTFGLSAEQLRTLLWTMVEFTDKSGRRWKRRGAAQPERLLDPSPDESTQRVVQQVAVDYA